MCGRDGRKVVRKQTEEGLYTRDLVRSIPSILVVTELSRLANCHWHGTKILFAGFPLDVRNSCQGHGHGVCSMGGTTERGPQSGTDRAQRYCSLVPVR